MMAAPMFFSSCGDDDLLPDDSQEQVMMEWTEPYHAKDSSVEEVKAFTASLNEKINSNDNNIGLLLNDRQIYDGLTQVLTSTDALLTDLKGHPKRYVHFSLFGKKDK